MRQGGELVEDLRREVERELDRTADRLAVVAPRLATRRTPEALTALAQIASDLQALADHAATAEGMTRRRVPALAPHALADQVRVLGADLLRAGTVAPGVPAGGAVVDAGTDTDAGAVTAALTSALQLLGELRRRL